MTAEAIKKRYGWDFSTLTDEQKEEVRRLHQDRKTDLVLEIYKAAGAIPPRTCSSCKLNKVVRSWTEFAIQQNLI